LVPAGLCGEPARGTAPLPQGSRLRSGLAQRGFPALGASGQREKDAAEGLRWKQRVEARAGRTSAGKSRRGLPGVVVPGPSFKPTPGGMQRK